jgi:hypothetical protein
MPACFEVMGMLVCRFGKCFHCIDLIVAQRAPVMIPVCMRARCHPQPFACRQQGMHEEANGINTDGTGHADLPIYQVAHPPSKKTLEAIAG